MPMRTPRPALALFVGMTAFLSVLAGGCKPARQASSAIDRTDPDAAAERTETERVAEAALGNHAEVLEHGDLARNGLEQILAVNRMAKTQRGNGDSGGPAPILILRAAILEKNGGRWAEVLRCDEHLKNPNGYLAGSPAARVSGWRLAYRTDAWRGLEMNFSPADADMDTQGRAVVVRWNTKAKRYQSLDASQDRYLSEVPTVETPLSILK
jgi:hypothetical protein